MNTCLRCPVSVSPETNGRTQRSHPQTRRNDGGLYARGPQEIAIVSIPDLVPETPRREEFPHTLVQGFPNLGSYQNHLGGLKQTNSCPPFQDQSTDSLQEREGALHLYQLLLVLLRISQVWVSALPCSPALHPSLQEAASTLPFLILGSTRVSGNCPSIQGSRLQKSFRTRNEVSL